MSPGARVLLLRRSRHVSDHRGKWNLPGGGIEPGETARDAAAREAAEEARFDRRRHRAQVQWLHDGPLYTTVVARLRRRRFRPTLNWESDAWVWATRKQALELDLHPELRKLLDKLDDDFAPPTGRASRREEGPIDWSRTSIRRHTLEEITTGGLANPFDGPELDRPQLHLVADLQPTEDRLSTERVEQLAQAMITGEYDDVRPIIVEDYNYIVDGHHRAAAAALAGVTWHPVQELHRYGRETTEPPTPRGRSARRSRFRSVERVKHLPKVEALVAAEADMVRALLPAAEGLLATTTLVVGRPTDQAFFHPPDKFLIGSTEWSADLMAHEIGHLFDSRAWRGAGQCVFGTDRWGCREEGALRDVTRKAKSLFKRSSSGLLESRVRAVLRAALPRPAARRVARGENLRIEAILADMVPEEFEVVSAYATPFGGFDVQRFVAQTGTSAARAQKVAAAMRLLPIGVPLSLAGEEAEAFTRTVRRAEVERRVAGYFLASHEVFARLFDQAVRTRAARQGILAGSRKHPLDLPPEAFAEVEEPFWSVAEERGWTR